MRVKEGYVYRITYKPRKDPMALEKQAVVKTEKEKKAHEKAKKEAEKTPEKK